MDASLECWMDGWMDIVLSETSKVRLISTYGKDKTVTND